MINIILKYFNLNIVISFINDVKVKQLYNNYNNKESLFKIY